MVTKKSQANNKSGRWVSILLVVFIGIFFFLAQSATWMNNTIFDREFFTTTTTSTFLEEENRQAIGQVVVDKALADNPAAQRIIGDRAVMFISSLLGSDVSTQVVTKVVDKTYDFMTRPNRQDIVLDLSAIRAPVAALLTVAQNQGDNARVDAIDVESIPSEIVLIEESEYPNFSGTVQFFLWFEPLTWLLTAGLAVLYVYLGRKNYVKRIYTVGFTLVAVSILGLIIGPFIAPPFGAMAATAEMGSVIESIATAFVAPFMSQMWTTLLWLAAALLVFSQRAQLLKLLDYIRDKLSKKS